MSDCLSAVPSAILFTIIKQRVIFSIYLTLPGCVILRILWTKTNQEQHNASYMHSFVHYDGWQHAPSS